MRKNRRQTGRACAGLVRTAAVLLIVCASAVLPSAARANKTCVGGPVIGQPCTNDLECGRCTQGAVGAQCEHWSDCQACVGGSKPGIACTIDFDCPGTCVGGLDNLQQCYHDANCRGECQGGVSHAQPCSSDDDCADICIGGARDGQACFITGPDQCPYACVGGGRDGLACTSDVDCEQQTCVGGFSDGEGCTSNDGCTSACIYGVRDGQPCNIQNGNQDCGRACVGLPAMPCQSNTDCPVGYCVGGSYNGGPCEQDSGCGWACVGGGRHGSACDPANPSCPTGCTGGSSPGKECADDTDCPRACSGGDRDGLLCKVNAHCPGASCSELGTCTEVGTCTPGVCPASSCGDSGTCSNHGSCIGPAGTCTDHGDCPSDSGQCENMGVCPDTGECKSECNSGDCPDVSVEVIEVYGGEYGASENGPWSPIEEGQTLQTCTFIRLPANSSIRWIRKGACTNTGKVEGSGAGEVRVLHVGDGEITPVDPGQQRAGEGMLLMFGAVDLVYGTGIDASEVTIIEGPGCTETDHCGINSPIAQCAPIDDTPMGRATTFSGRLVQTPSGPEVTFSVSPETPISLATTPLVGPALGTLIMVAPGECITYFADGSFDTEECGISIPTVSEWGLIVLTLLGMTAATIMLARRRRLAAA